MLQRLVLSGVFLSILLLGACQRDHKKESAPQAKAADSLFLAYETLRRDTSANVVEKLRLNKQLLTRYGGTGDSLEFELLKHRAGMYRSLGQLDSTLIYAKKLLDRATDMKDSVNMAEAYYRLGFYNRLTDQYDTSLEAYYRAVEFYKSLGDSINAGRKLLNLANLLNQMGSHFEAEDLAVQGLEYLEGTQGESEKLYISGLYNALAISAMHTQNYPDALSWYRKALELGAGPPASLRFRTNIATVYMRQQRYEAARELLQELADDPFFKSGEYPVDLARILDLLGWAKSNLGEEDAEKLMLQALGLREEAEFQRGILESLLHLSEHYSNSDLAMAREIGKRAYALAQELNVPNDKLGALTLLMEYAKNPRAYALEFQRVSDSLSGARERTRDNFAKIRFESEQNLKNYLSAAEEVRQKTNELNQARQRNILLLAVLVLLVIGAYLGYRSLKARSRLKRLKESFEAENRISKRVHDELANDLFNIMTFASQHPLDSDKHKELLIGQLDRAYARSRNIARESAPAAIGKDFKQELKGLADSYNSEDTRILIKGMETFPWERLQEIGRITCYRVLQELLVNMKKHSGATLVLLEFTRPGSWLQVRYKDNGVGLPSEKRAQRNGLANAEDRIRALGGSFSVSADSGSGVECTFSLPLN